MELDWYCTGVFGMRQQNCWGVLWFSKRSQVSLMKKQRNRQHVIWCLTTNTWANNVTIVSSVITKIFNPSKHWTVMIQPQSISIHISCQFLLLFLSCLILISLDSVLFYSIIQCSITHLLSVFSVLILELYLGYFDPHIKNHPASQ
jgi:hypothetical protein